MSHGIVGPGEEGGLDAVDGARPIIRRELPRGGDAWDQDEDSNTDGRDCNIVTRQPSSTEDVGAEGPQQRAYDSDSL